MTVTTTAETPFYDPFDWHWIVGDDESRFWSSAEGDWVDTLPEGAGVTRIGTFDELVDVLRSAGVPPYHKVRTYTVVTRLQFAGLLEAAEMALNADPTAKWRFTTADGRGGIDADAEDVRMFLTAIGADVDEILAPEMP